MPHLYTPFNIKDWLDAKMPGANNAKIHVVAHCPTYDDSSKSNTISWKAETQGYYMNFEADVEWKLNLPAVAFRPWRQSAGGVGTLYYANGPKPTGETTWTAVTDNMDEIPAYQDTNGDGYYHLYLRGEGILQVTGSEAGACTGTFTGGTPTHARISGDLQTLLDWRQVAIGERPEAGEYAFAYMFENWQDPDGTAFKDVIMGTLELPKYCYKGIYKNVKGLKSVAISKGQWLSEGCYESAFEGCTDLEELPEKFNLTVPALAKRCYARLFYNCRSLKRVPENLLPAKVMADECYREMFWGCESLENTPDLNVTTLAEKCFKGMFEGCYKITSIPKYPLADVKFAQGCFNGMFRDCEGLVDLREATCGTTGTTADACYQSMFQGCTNLKYPPKIISSGVDGKMMPLQYAQMFDGCTSLIALPEGDLFTGTLKNTLAESCFKEMFRGCSSLTKLVPDMLSQYSAFPGHCCEMMFSECSSLKMSEIEQDHTYCIFKINADVSDIGPDAFVNMFRETGGRWTENPRTKTNYYNYLAANYVKFESSKSFALMLPAGDGTVDRRTEAPADETKPFGLYYCYDTSVASPVWTEWKYYEDGKVNKLLDAHNIGTIAEPHYVLYMKGSNIGRINKYGAIGSDAGNQTGWVFRESSTSLVPPDAGIKVSGQMDCILDAEAVEMGRTPTRLGSSSFGAFSNWFSVKDDDRYSSYLVDASELEPASSDGNTTSLYANMFRGCRSLVHPPKELPQEIVSKWEYQNMFCGCSALTHTPEIKATSVDTQACFAMFRGCTNLIQVADIWISSFRHNDIYPTDAQCQYMFDGCTSLATLPNLRARELAKGCYAYMFQNCSSLKLSDQPSEDYPTPWKFPYIGTPGTIGENAVKHMFMGIGAFPGETKPIKEGTPEPGKNYYIYSQASVDFGYITFYSDYEFNMQTNPTSDGAVYWSADHKTWKTWDGSLITAEISAVDNKYYLYFYGDGNTIITGQNGGTVNINASGAVYVKGCLENLLDAPKVKSGHHVVPGEAAYYQLFKNCSKLDFDANFTLFATITNESPILTKNMFGQAFMDCGISSVPDMSSIGDVDVPDECFKETFSGCHFLTTASGPTGTTIGASAFQSMYENCTELSTINGTFPATTIGAHAYEAIFSGCTGLVKAPELPATTAGDSAYKQMFKGCAALTSAPAISATSFGDYACAAMFSGCTSLTAAPTINATTLGKYACLGMFHGCTALTSVPNLANVTTFSEACCREMFNGCNNTGLTSLANISIGSASSTLAKDCCNGMFINCTHLTTPPTLPATTLAENCYQYMFGSCALTSIPNLPGADSSNATGCYLGMFSGCTGLVDLSTYTVSLKNIGATSCAGMFNGCTGLKKAPKFPAVDEIGAAGCATMFSGCTSLEYSEDLVWSKVTTVGRLGCQQMFSGCTSLKRMPALYAKNIAYGSYAKMFENCSSVKISQTVHDNYDTPFKIPHIGETETCDDTAFFEMFKTTGGEYKDDPVKHTVYFMDIGNVVTMPDYVEFRSDGQMWLQVYGNMMTPLATKFWDGNLYYNLKYPTDEGFASSWTELLLTNAQATIMQNQPGGDGLYHMYLRGLNNSYLSDGESRTHFQIGYPLGNSVVYTYGNISKMMHYDSSTTAPTPAEGAFYALFMNNPKVASGPTLDYTEPTARMYQKMFCDCTKLITAPVNKMTTTAESCCEGMFYRCINLTSISAEAGKKALQPVALAKNCYKQMFMNCSGLKSIDDNTLATLNGALSESCCEEMFKNCTELTNIAGFGLGNTVSFTDDAGNNFKGMYEGCISIDDSSLTRFRTSLNGAALATSKNVTAYLFRGCTKLTDASKLFDDSFRITSLGPGCFKGMFEGCTSLTNAGFKIKTGASTVTTMAPLKESCYEEMFKGCTSLVDTSGWYTLNPSDGLAAKYCFKSMFEGCTKLNSAFAFNINTLAEGCFQRMFYGCSAMTHVATLDVIDLKPYCYAEMYSGCDATYAKPSEQMVGRYLKPYSVPTTPLADASVDHAADNMFGSEFIINRTYFLRDDSAASENTPYVLFHAVEAEKKVKIGISSKTWNGTLEYSTDKTTWNVIDTIPEDGLLVSGANVYFRGQNNTVITGYSSGGCWTAAISGIYASTQWEISGNLAAMLDYSKAGADATENPIAGAYAFSGWFKQSTVLEVNAEKLLMPMEYLGEAAYKEMFWRLPKVKKAPAVLPSYSLKASAAATEPSAETYSKMFAECASLTTVPRICSLTTAKETCYGMFYKCTSLTTAPVLPATTLALGCYMGMFNGCIALTTTSPLVATTLAESCYESMFEDCVALVTPPAIKATTSAKNCGKWMFTGCTALTTLPKLYAKNASNYCYYGMFDGCSALSLSATSTGTTTKEYTIPWGLSGSAEGTLSPVEDMFKNISGGSVTVAWNGTYYTVNDPV